MPTPMLGFDPKTSEPKSKSHPNFLSTHHAL